MYYVMDRQFYHYHDLINGCIIYKYCKICIEQHSGTYTLSIVYRHKQPCDGYLTFWGPVYKHGLALIASWISNYTHCIVWVEITYPFPNSDCCTVEVWEWKSNFFPTHWVCNPCLYKGPLTSIQQYLVGFNATVLVLLRTHVVWTEWIQVKYR